MTVISNLEVLISADIANFTSGLTTVKTGLTGLGTSIATSVTAVGLGVKTVGDKFTSLGANISSAIGPLDDIAMSGLDAAASFQDVMTQLETFGGLAGDELEEVRQAALDMGAATMFSAGDAASAMLELVKAGYSVDDSMVAAKASLDLAAVGNMGLEQSAAVVSSALSQFGLDVDDAAEVVDTLAAGANASRSDVAGLADSLTNVGVVASTMGFSLDETVAALSVMANAGIEGAEAGTQLKSALLNLTTSTPAKDALEGLGVSLYTVEGNMKSLDEIVDELSVAMADLTPEEQTNMLKDLGGAYGITALSALLAAGGTDAMLAAMAEAPSATDLAAKSMETFNGKVEGLKGSVETLMIQALTPLMDNVLAPLVELVTEVVNSITEWAGENPELASTVGGLVLGIGALGTGLAILGPIVSGIGMAISGLGIVLGVATGPVGLLAFAIGGLIALLNSEGIQEGLKAWEGVFQNFAIIAEAAVNDVRVGIASFVRDLEVTLLDIQSKAAAAQVAIGINVEANSAIVTSSTSAMQLIDIAKTLEDDINTSLANGGALQINAPQIEWLASDEAEGMMGQDGIAALASKIADPLAIQQAVDAAIAQGNTEALTALLPLALELAEDPATQMQELLTTALDVGGENSPVFAVLAATATELDIDVAGVTAQYDAALKEAAAAQTFNIEVIANVRVRTADIDMSGVQQAVTMGPAAPPANTSPLVPKLAVGGYIEGSGLAYVHAGEVVLNKQQQEAWNGGGSGGNTFIINAYGSTPQELAAMIERAQRDRAL